MDNISDWFYHHKMGLIASFILIVSMVGGAFYLTYVEAEEQDQWISEVEEKDEPKIEEALPKEKEEEIEVLWRVDIKGCIQNPGVYQVTENTRIHEVIDMAGGFTKNAISVNINLSKKVSDEMVIYIYSQEEWEEKKKCTVENTYNGEISKEISDKQSIIEKEETKEEKKTEKISLNQASKEELMTLDGIGSFKADSIIEYRTKHQGFQTIEELKNVSGIGETLYESIKDRLTI